MRRRTGYRQVSSANCLWILPLYFRAAGQRRSRYENMPFLGPDLECRRALGGMAMGRKLALVAVAFVIVVAGAVTVVMTSPDVSAGDFPSLFRPISMSFP